MFGLAFMSAMCFQMNAQEGGNTETKFHALSLRRNAIIAGIFVTLIT